MIDSILAKKIAAKTGIDVLTVVREFVQVLYLNELYALPNIGKTIFKGGTALRLMLGSNRFSEDLDFSTNLDKNALTIVTNKAVTNLTKQIPDVSVKDLVTLTGVSKKIYVATEFAKQPLTIKLDYSQREQPLSVMQGVIDTLLPVNSTILITYLDPTEILAEKCRALMTRTKGRDVYDIWYLLRRGVTIDPMLIQQKLNYYHEQFNLSELIDRVKKWDAKELDQDIRRFLPIKDRAVLTKIKDLLIAKLTIFL